MRVRSCERRSLGACLVAFSAACTPAQNANDGPAVFGGQGAQVASVEERPLPAASNEPEPVGPCGRHAPPSETALVDDFEDGDGKIFKGFEREGYWYAASDNTHGSEIKPFGDFSAELLPESESTKENRYAAHLSAKGQKEWGVLFGTGLAWTRKGLKCPLNLSAFEGFRFRAKGPGTIRVTFSVPEVMPRESGGLCKEGCYDTHGKHVLLTDRWETYEVRWGRVQQGGWGTEARFTPERIVNLGFAVDVKALPIDFWIDDLEFLPAPAVARAQAAAD